MNEINVVHPRNALRLKWKITDLVGQIGTIVLPFLWLVFLSGSNEDAELIMFKSMVIANLAWVMLSLLLHIWVWRAPWIIPGRKILSFIYGAILISELLYGVFVAPHNMGGRSGPPDHAVVMLALIACIPIMGIPYFFISILELNRLKVRLRNGGFRNNEQA